MGEQNTRKRRHYIIVVHGIGEQKLNQTATEVVHRFAEVRWKDRHPNPKSRQYQNLLPADLSGQSVRRRGAGHGWSEFKGIPVDPNDDTGEFDGNPATEKAGRNFRFVDLHWQHILQWHQKEYASPAEKWAPAVLERVRTVAPAGWIPLWAKRLLKSVVDTALPIKKLLSFRYPDVAKLMFDDFLGDVHLYGDYARTRGKAVRHFHVILDEIHLRDFIDWCKYGEGGADRYEPPVYTVIAHSLGSIMSFDALVYAYARKKEVRERETTAAHSSPSLPFPGYKDEAEGEKETWGRLIGQLETQIKKNKRNESEGNNADSEIRSLIKENDGEFPAIPPLLWRNQVRNFITLGSPIDKYHVIWFQNYLHMGLRRKDDKQPGGYRRFWESEKHWAEEWLDEPDKENKIVHYNLCDEQDPVGHHLDIAQASVNYEKIFDISIPVAYRDVVFRRYAVPGVAHVKYWEDGDLFWGIIKDVIDRERGPKEPDPELTEYETQNDLQGSYFLRGEFRNRRGVYEKALQWAYFRVPLLAALVTGGLLSYGLLGWVQTGFAISYLAAIVAAILLWTCPRPTEEYAQEAEPQEVRLEKKGPALWWERWKPRRSILAHLVAGMVEWRRVLIMLSEGESTDRETCIKGKMHLALKAAGEKAGQFSKEAKKRYVVGTVILVVSAFLASPYLTKLALDIFPDVVRSKIQLAGIIGMILSLCYLLTRLYVGRVYRETKKRVEQTAG